MKEIDDTGMNLLSIELLLRQLKINFSLKNFELEFLLFKLLDPGVSDRRIFFEPKQPSWLFGAKPNLLEVILILVNID